MDYKELIIYPDDTIEKGKINDSLDESERIRETPEKEEVYHADIELVVGADTKTDTDNAENTEDGEIDNKKASDINVQEAIDIISANPLISYFLEYIFWHFCNLGIGIIEKRKILKKKTDDYEKYSRCLSKLGSVLKISPCENVFKTGSWYEAFSDKRYIRNRMKFYGIDWLYIVTCLRYICKINILWYQILGVFFGPRALSDETWKAFQYLFEVIGMRKLQDALPVDSLDDAMRFSELSDQDVFNYIASAHSILLPESYRKRWGIKDRFRVIERYLENYNIKIPLGSPRNIYGASFDNLSSMKIQLYAAKKEEAVILYDDYYMEDEMLKQQVEAFAYEKNISVIYCRKQQAM